MATIDAHYFRVCTRGAERQGHDRADLLAAGGVTPEMADTPGWRGSVESMSRIVRAVWHALDDEHMGCTGQRVRTGALATMTELAMRGENVLDGLAKGIAFYRLLTDAVDTSLEERGDRVVLTVRFAHPECDPDHYFTEFWMITWHRLASWLSGETVGVAAAEFRYDRPLSYFSEFAHLFPAPLRFNRSDCALHLEKGALRNAIVRSESDRREFAARLPLDFMTIPSRADSMADRVRRLLSPPAGQRFEPMPLEEMAGVLGVSALSVQRALRAEGTAYRRIVESVRRDLAIAHLRRGNATIEAIAAELGYAEPRSFTRAFRQWTGTSPLRFRRAQVSPD